MKEKHSTAASKKVISKQWLSAEAKENIKLDKIIKCLKAKDFSPFKDRSHYSADESCRVIAEVLESAEILRKAVDQEWKTLDQIYSVQINVKTLMKQADYSNWFYGALNSLQAIANNKIEQRWDLKKNGYKTKYAENLNDRGLMFVIC